MKKLMNGLIAVLLASALAACSSLVRFESIEPDTRLSVESSARFYLPRSSDYNTKTFGDYKFMVEAGGQEPFYGELPMKFNTVYFLLDFVWLPGFFYNLYSPYAIYEVDESQQLIRYKQRRGDQWQVYKPTADEAEAAKAYFAPALERELEVRNLDEQQDVVLEGEGEPDSATAQPANETGESSDETPNAE